MSPSHELIMDYHRAYASRRPDQIMEGVLVGAVVALGLLALEYQSAAPVLVYGGTFLVGVVSTQALVRRWEVTRGFVLLYLCGICAGAISGAYAQWFDDSGQLLSDAGGFHELATTDPGVNRSLDSFGTHEGPLAIVAWRSWYELWASAGVEPARYVGLALNSALTGGSAVLATMLGRIVAPTRPLVGVRIQNWLAACGILWLAAGLHLRDAFVVFAILLLTYMWAAVLTRPSWIALSGLIVTILCWDAYANWLRRGLVDLGLVFAAAFAGALALRVVRTWFTKSRGWSLLAVIGAAGLLLVWGVGPSLGETAASAREGYDSLRLTTAASSTTSTALLHSPILPIRIAWGTAHLFFFPVPCWSYLVIAPESAYFLFKAAYLPYLWLLMPAAGSVLLSLHRLNLINRVAAAFLGLVSIALVAAVAATSIEGRHAMPAVVLLTVLAAVAIEFKDEVRSVRRLVARGVAGALVLLHLIWAIT